jgi:CubicO group peptidase (beta-lactamase class C family)
MRMRTFLAAIGAVLLALAGGPAAGASPASSRIDAILAPWSGARPGVVVVVVSHARVAFARAYGMADVAARKPLSLDGAMPLDSLTKQVTAAAIVSLERERRLGFDDLLERHLPQVHAPGVTLRALLRHRSGLPDLSTALAPGASLADIVSAYAAADLSGVPRDAPYAYNNAGYALLAAVIERASSQPFESFVRARLLERAGMHATFMASAGAPTPGLARAYRGGAPYEAPVHEQPPGGGGLVTTARDLARWYQALDRGDLVEGYEDAIHQLAGSTAPTAHVPAYAAGWVLGRSRALERWSHGGSWRGSKNYVLRYPSRQLTVILLSNAYEFGAHRHTIAYRVAEAFLPELAVAGEKVARVSDACVAYAIKRTRDATWVLDGAEDIAAWHDGTRWEHDPWPYGSDLQPGPMAPC